MFQDIGLHKFHNEYVPKSPRQRDYIIFLRDGKVLMHNEMGVLTVPQYRVMLEHVPIGRNHLTYLFSIDHISFFLSHQEIEASGELEYEDMRTFQQMEPAWLAFAGATAVQLAKWYESHTYCGRCTEPMKHHEEERSLLCPQCGLVEYPKISPVVIVGITNGEHILLTKYSDRPYNRHALIAGFVEIGESFEDAIRREVMEEVGLKVTNIRYYQSQPWAFSDSVLAGFFVDVEGSTDVKLDTKELSEAKWYHRDEIPPGESMMSLTWNMVERFREGPV